MGGELGVATSLDDMVGLCIHYDTAWLASLVETSRLYELRGVQRRLEGRGLLGTCTSSPI